MGDVTAGGADDVAAADGADGGVVDGGATDGRVDSEGAARRFDERTRLTIADGVARLALARPEARNGIDRRMVDAFGAAVSAAAADPSVRAVLVQADGDHFSVGGDLAHFANRIDALGEELDAMITAFHATYAALATLPAPVVLAVQGAFAGGALGLAGVADVVVAADDLRVATGFTALGLSGDGGTSWSLPRLVGLRRAQELVLENRVIDAETALDWGLVTRVVPRAELEAEAERTVRRLAAGPTQALARAGGLLRASAATTFADRLVQERDAMRQLGGTEDAVEGVRAFGARRTPDFQGSRPR